MKTFQGWKLFTEIRYTINLQCSLSFLEASRRQRVCSLFTRQENANSFAPLWKPRLNRTEDQYTRSTILGPRESNFDEEIPTFVEIIFLNQGLCQTIIFFTRGLWDMYILSETIKNYCGQGKWNSKKLESNSFSKKLGIIKNLYATVETIY